MVRPPSSSPTELELLILKVLWRKSPQTVREVREALATAGRKLAHTSVITTLNVMVRKKYLRRSMQGNACLFAPRLTHTAVYAPHACRRGRARIRRFGESSRSQLIRLCSDRCR